MKIIIVGGTGTIGKRVTAALQSEGKHEVIVAGLKSGDIQMDIRSVPSIVNFFDKLGPFDALISTTGAAQLGYLYNLKEEDMMVGIQGKLLAQINLVLVGLKSINAGGSFTLTSGILAEEPIMQGAACTVADAAVNAFVKAAAIELKSGVRINAVAPGVVEDSPALHQFFPNHKPVAMSHVTTAYIKSVLSNCSGEVLRAY
jgi:NAD(P)-dependent dehydrogenase (short-subunit alcohol dehydrogenase family)